MWRLRCQPTFVRVPLFHGFMWVDEVELSCGLPNDFFVLDFCWISPGGGGGGENFDFELHQFYPPNWQRIGCTFTIIHDKTTTCLRNYYFQSRDFIALIGRQAYNVSERCFCVGVSLLSLLSTSGLVSCSLGWLKKAWWKPPPFLGLREFLTMIICLILAPSTFTLVYIDVFTQIGFRFC